MRIANQKRRQELLHYCATACQKHLYIKKKSHQYKFVFLKRVKHGLINQEMQRGTAVAWESEETESQLTTASLLSIDAWFKSGFILRGNGAKLLEIIQCSTK